MGELPGWLQDWFSARRSPGKREIAAPSKALATIPDYLKNRNSPRLIEDAMRGIEFDPPPYEDIAACLEAIPNPDLGWDDYNDVLMATWASGGDETQPLAEQWARKSKKYLEVGLNTVAARFADYHRCPPTRIGFGTLLYEARQAVRGFILPSERSAKLNGHKVEGLEGANGHAFHFGTSTAAGGPIFIDLNDKENRGRHALTPGSQSERSGLPANTIRFARGSKSAGRR